MVEELKASQEKSLSQVSELHAKEFETLQGQVDKFKQELSSSKDKTQELEKMVSELQPYKEQAQVSANTFWCIFIFGNLVASNIKMVETETMRKMYLTVLGFLLLLFIYVLPYTLFVLSC